MNRLSTERRSQILDMMAEGMPIRFIARQTGCSKNTVVKLLRDAGEACAAYQDRVFRDLPCKRVQIDEIWSFDYAKAKTAPTAKKAPAIVGDIWTWTAIDVQSKLVPSWYVGYRDGEAARVFIGDLASRLKHRVRLTSDGLKTYLEAVENSFSAGIDNAQLAKLYGTLAGEGSERRYSAAECAGGAEMWISGKPDRRHITTPHFERKNLSMHMGKRGFTRLTSALSKKIENQVHAVSIYFMYYNFVRIHQTLGVSPAMAVGVTESLWEIDDIVRIVDRWEAARISN